MKNFFKKLNKGQDVEQDDLNLDYGDFYTGRDNRGSDRADDRGGVDRRQDAFEEPRRQYDEPRRDEPVRERSADNYYDVQKTNRGGYEEPDFKSDHTRYYDADRQTDRVVAERPVERVVEHSAEQPVAREDGFVKPRETWQEADAPGYRPAQPEAEPVPAPAPAPTPVFTPAPAPEYLYFTPSTYRDCREGIVKGMASGHVVVVRLRKLEANDVLRLFDYMMGAVLALEGELVRPVALTVVLVPKDVAFNESELEPDEDEEIAYEDDEESEEEYDDEEYDEEYEEDSYEDGEYGSYDEDEEYDEEYDDASEEEYDEDEYDDEYDEEYDEEYEDEYDEEYEDEEYDEQDA